jgi:hypothetical protein
MKLIARFISALAIAAAVGASTSARDITTKDLLDGLPNPARWLYEFSTGCAIYAPPTTYLLDGRQFVVMPSGTTLTAFALSGRPR